MGRPLDAVASGVANRPPPASRQVRESVVRPEPEHSVIPLRAGLGHPAAQHLMPDQTDVLNDLDGQRLRFGQAQGAVRRQTTGDSWEWVGISLSQRGRPKRRRDTFPSRRSRPAWQAPTGGTNREGFHLP